MGIDFPPLFWARNVLNHFLRVTASAHPVAPAGRAWGEGRRPLGGARVVQPRRADGAETELRPGRLCIMESALKTMLSPLSQALMDAADACETRPRPSHTQGEPSGGRRSRQTGRRWGHFLTNRPVGQVRLSPGRKAGSARSPQSVAGGRAPTRGDSLRRHPRSRPRQSALREHPSFIHGACQLAHG